MCGFCGEIVFGSPSSASVLQQMLGSLVNRGPDGAGLLLRDNVGLGHRRLSILDLAATSQQPMLDSELGLAVAFNGCIYNYRELRRELISKGYRFFSSGDTEVILKAYAAWGPRCVERFLGMFAFAVWERDSGKVVLARDRLGIKPLYYASTAAGLRFASTLPSLLAAGGIDTSIDSAALHHYMSWHRVVPPPLTMLKGGRKLPPAQIMSIEPDGRESQETYWTLSVQTRPADRGTSEAEWAEQVLATLTLAVERRMVADVPVGVLLSGGLDSSLLVALLANRGQKGLKTFSIGFESVDDIEGDEFRYSDLIARHFGTEHHRIRVNAKAALDALPGTIGAMAEPMMSHDAVGFYLLSQEVAKHVKVAQSGQGADEIFGGYHWYPKLRRSNDLTDDYAKVYFDRTHEEMGEALHSS